MKLIYTSLLLFSISTCITTSFFIYGCSKSTITFTILNYITDNIK